MNAFASCFNLPKEAYASAFGLPSGSPAVLTITFGAGIVSNATFFLTINGTAYSFSMGQEGVHDVPIWFDNDGVPTVYDGFDVANFFTQYIQTTFPSLLTVSRSTNVVTLTTTATTGASLSATCSLAIFPNVPLT